LWPIAVNGAADAGPASAGFDRLARLRPIAAPQHHVGEGQAQVAEDLDADQEAKEQEEDPQLLKD
jgi:hypothetical protein